jgi:hypothetical protein
VGYQPEAAEQVVVQQVLLAAQRELVVEAQVTA